MLRRTLFAKISGEFIKFNNFNKLKIQSLNFFSEFWFSPGIAKFLAVTVILLKREQFVSS